MGYHALAWLTEDTSIHALKRQMTCGDVCEAPPAHKTPVTTVISQFSNRSSPSPAAEWGNHVLYLVPLLQGTEVIFITYRSLSVDSLGTTH